MNTNSRSSKYHLAVKRFFPALVVVLLALAGCQDLPSSQYATQTVEARSKLPEGFYLVIGEEAIPLHRYLMGGGKGIDVSDLPHLNESQPVALLQTSDFGILEYVSLIRMAGGIGVSVNEVDDSGGLVIGSIWKGYGAEAAGLQNGDVIRAVDGQELAEIADDEVEEFLAKVDELMLGELGSAIELTVQRQGEQLDLAVTRNYPSKASDVKHWAFSHEQTPEGYEKLTPDEPLIEGLYCYWQYVPARLPGDFYCFVVGDDAFAQSIRSLAGNEAPQ